MPDGQLTGGKRKSMPRLTRLLGGRHLLAVGLCTAGINILALTGPLYMLLLYGRVLPSRDTDELLTLTLLMLALYALSALLDVTRQRVFARCALRVDRWLIAGAARHMRSRPVHDLDQIRAFLIGHGPSALCDLPWLPFYLAAMFLLHPLFGLLAAGAALSVAGCLLVAERMTGEPAQRAARTAEQRWKVAAALSREAGCPAPANRQAWIALNARLRDEQDAAARPAMMAAAVVRALRPALQSATLGLGIYLAMVGACADASILAAAIVLPRVLAPLEMAIAHWRSFKAARRSAARLHSLMPQSPSLSARPPSSATRGGVHIILRKRSDQARSASGAGARSMSSGLRPTAE